jgi:hypothetical protein
MEKGVVYPATVANSVCRAQTGVFEDFHLPDDGQTALMIVYILLREEGLFAGFASGITNGRIINAASGDGK